MRKPTSVKYILFYDISNFNGKSINYILDGLNQRVNIAAVGIEQMQIDTLLSFTNISKEMLKLFEQLMSKFVVIEFISANHESKILRYLFELGVLNTEKTDHNSAINELLTSLISSDDMSRILILQYDTLRLILGDKINIV